MTADTRASHTPGPWIIDRRFSHKWGSVECIGVELSPDSGPHTNGRTWAVALVPCHPDYDPATYRNDAEAEANARLIATAPELLSAAKTLRDCYSNPHVHEHESCWATLEAAIDKAEGRKS